MSNQQIIAVARILEGKIAGKDELLPEERHQLRYELAVLYREDRVAFGECAKEVRPFIGCASLESIGEWVKQIIDRTPTRPEMDVSNELIALGDANAKLWHSQLRKEYATFERKGHLEHHLIESQDFRNWLSATYSERHQREINGKLMSIYPARADLTEALDQIKAYALDGECIQPGLRLMEWNGAVWIDGGGSDWSGYRVTADNWDWVPRLEAPLVRASGMKELPKAERGGDIKELLRFIKFKDEDDLVLFCGDLAMTLNVFGDFNTTIFCGPPGSAKTTVTQLFRALTDPNEIATRRFASVRDLMHGIGNTHIMAFENVSEISDELSDAICSINTGTGYSERRYYEQGTEFNVKVRRPVLINGIPDDLATRTDLLDRTICFEFDYLREFKSKDMLWRRFEEAAPGIFGAVLDGLVGAMSMRREFDNNNDEAAAALLGDWRPRFLDGIVWAEAACRAMGFNPGEFVRAFKNNQLFPLRKIAETDSVCVGIKKLMEKQEYWRGYPKALHVAIDAYGVPTVEYLSRRLRQVIPVLVKICGIYVTLNKRLNQDDNRNGIIIEKGGVGRGSHFEPQLEPPSATDSAASNIESQPSTVPD